MTIILKNKETLQFDKFKFKCSIGKNGLKKRKTEGDFSTPKGTFEIENLYFRNDRIKKPETRLKCIKIKKNMGWCNDTKNKIKYNRIINIDNDTKCEKLYRNDNKYNLFIPIKYNFRKPKIGKGSAIFIHLTNNYKFTAGCIALKKNDLLILLRLINKKTKIKIG
tara:strand:+ start:379 stop:873 length:495 start_codon:yes stop_codon:yes gene_type:complete